MPKTTSAVDLGVLIGSKEACRLLDIDKSTLTRWVARGELVPAMRLGDSANSAFLFRKEDIDAIKEPSQVRKAMR